MTAEFSDDPVSRAASSHQSEAGQTPAFSLGGAARQRAALAERQRAFHALNRLGFGPKPDDVRTVMEKGVMTWITEQLHPEGIDDSALDAHLAPYLTTRMSPERLAHEFPSDDIIRDIIARKRPMPSDPAQRLIYSVSLARIEQQNVRSAAMNSTMNSNSMAGNSMNASPMAGGAMGGSTAMPDRAATTSVPSQQLLLEQQIQSRAIADGLLALPKEQRFARLHAIPPERLVNFPNRLRPDQRDRLYADCSPREREIFRALGYPAGLVAGELQQAKLVRAVYSERQLLEVMTDFWTNHFSVYQYKDQCTHYTTAYERDAIRPHALGKFYDLLVATAQSPAMLIYLDNCVSTGPHSRALYKNGESGLNENYGRELMELQTLGVDGGYTQSDVIELAKILTGWTVERPDDGGGFVFDARQHEPGAKTFLGSTIQEAGVNEGLLALRMLARHPATARFISHCIAVRFVSDNPPETLLGRMADTFQRTDGDIREVLRVMFCSLEFWSPDVYRAKLKTPLDFVVSAVRASGATVIAPDALLQTLNRLGMAPYRMQTPAGYSMKARMWQNAGALLTRINFAIALAEGKLPGIPFDPNDLITASITNADGRNAETIAAEGHSSLDAAIALIEDGILHGELPHQQRRIIARQLTKPFVKKQIADSREDALRFAAALTLGSPEFQRR